MPVLSGLILDGGAAGGGGGGGGGALLVLVSVAEGKAWAIPLAISSACFCLT